MQYSNAKTTGAIDPGLYPEEMQGWGGGGINFGRGLRSMGSRFARSSWEVSQPAPRSFGNLFPEDMPRSVKVIPNEMLTKINGSNLAYVVLENGSLVVGKNNVLQGHIDLAGGKPVLAAGELAVHAGQIKLLDNASGHYRPSGIEAQRAAEDAFRRLGFKVDGKYVERSFK
jgi:filamentous hemagglutinin